MGLHPTARQYAQIILDRLPRAGPCSLTDIYGFCEAKDGGAQYFVRQALLSLTGDCRVRSLGSNLYATKGEGAHEGAPEDPPPRAAADPSPEGSSEAGDAVPEAPPEPEPPRPGYDHRPIETDDAPDAMLATGADDTAGQETRIMQTQTTPKPKTRRDGAKNGHGPKPKPWKGSKSDWVIAAVKATGTASFSDLFARAKREGIYEEQKSLGAALSALTSRKKLKRLERGVYAMPGAKVVYDADKAPAKRSTEDVKRVAEARKTAPPKKGHVGGRKPSAPAPDKPKPGRKPSAFRGVYEAIDAKIADAKGTEKAAVAGIADIDRRIGELQAERKGHVAKRDASRDALKRLQAARKKVAETESGISESLKS